MAKSVNYILSVLRLHLDYIEEAYKVGEYEDTVKVSIDAADMINKELLPKLREEHKDSEEIPF